MDDNDVKITVGKRILELFGYKGIDSACDGQQAIEAAEKTQYDLILLDLQMPILDGFSAQKRIRSSPLSRDPCIVALTANADQVSDLDGLSLRTVHSITMCRGRLLQLPIQTS